MQPGNATGPVSSPSEPIRTWVLRSLDDMLLVYAIRREVFVDEQGLTESVRDDPDDRYSTHVLASIGDQVVGIGRATFIGDESQIAWVAIRRPYRRHGVGWAIMQRLIDISREQSCHLISLNAQTHALSFYQNLGFHSVGRRFYMSNIEHQHMIMNLKPTAE